MTSNNAVLYFCILLTLGLFTVTNGQGVGALRLVRNQRFSTTQAFTSGIVQIYYQNSWGNICDDSSFGSDEANVICHQLAFTGASSTSNTGIVTTYGTDTSSTLLEDVNCASSDYLVLLQCSVTARYSTSCNTDTLDVYVVCYTTRIWNSPYSGQLRLIGGTYSNQGRLEVYCNGQWGTVCDDLFGTTDANVACRQLGYSDYSRLPYSTSLDGSSSQPIWLDNVPCSSSSLTCLAYCQNCPSSEFHNCNHDEDVTLECEFSLSRSSGPFTTLSTCQNADTVASSIGAIVGGIIAVIIFICVLVVTIPLCICCCLGVGVGASVGGSTRRNRAIVTTTAPATVTTTAVVTEANVAGSNQDVPPAYPASGYGAPPAYPQQPAGYPGYPPQQQAGYPAQETAGYSGYPPQQPAGYPGYPPQETAGYPGYPPQQPGGYPGYPPQETSGYPGYPPQESSGYPPQQPYPATGYPPQ